MYSVTKNEKIYMVTFCQKKNIIQFIFIKQKLPVYVYENICLCECMCLCIKLNDHGKVFLKLYKIFSKR